MPLPTTGITTFLVGDYLGVSERNVGGLCQSGSINQWSKHKPVPQPFSRPLTDSEFEGYSGKWGLKIMNKVTGFELTNTLSISAANMKSVVNYDWVHDVPTGGSRSPFRLGDFRGYYENAEPFLCPTQTSYKINLFDFPNGRGSLSIEFEPNLYYDSTNMVSINELKTVPFNSPYELGTWSLACADFNNNGSSFTLYKADNDLNNAGYEFDINVTAVGTHYLYFFLIDAYNENILPLPNQYSWNGLSLLTVTNTPNYEMQLWKVGSLLQSYYNQNIAEGGGYVTNYESEEYYGNDWDMNTLYYYNNANLCFKVTITAGVSFNFNRSEVKLGRDVDSTQFTTVTQLSTETKPSATGSVVIPAGTTMTMYILAPYNSYINSSTSAFSIWIKGVKMTETVDLVLEPYR